MADDGEQLEQQFYFMGALPLNRTLIYTLLGFFVW